MDKKFVFGLFVVVLIVWYMWFLDPYLPKVLQAQTYFRKSEVFHVTRNKYEKKADVDAFVKELGYTYATKAQLLEAIDAGAQWCSGGFLADSAGYPMQVVEKRGWCGGNKGYIDWYDGGKSPEAVAGATVYGIKPRENEVPEGYNIAPWYSSVLIEWGDTIDKNKWSRYDV